MANRLAASSSPYLLQHQDNPVDWYEWGDEALAAARERDVPIFLSVGYSACHWCHVMAHESFENASTARYMNDHFVNIKVDREERPDIDNIYMAAVQAMSGHGGWPMSVFLTPDGRPILGGTYYPPQDVGGRPSFRRVMEAVTHAWVERREELDDQAERLTAAVNRAIRPMGRPPERTVVDRAVASLLGTVDHEHGGFGGAPKFPQAPSLELLLRRLALDPHGGGTPEVVSALRSALDRMAAGGIHDHVGGGFARYAVDRTWLVPHFEKMLYDNAMLAHVYLRAWQLLGVGRYRTVAERTLDYLVDRMTDPGGGFHAAEDADSEGEEGKFYVWEATEFAEVVGDEAELMSRLYGVTAAGNFEGANILHLPVPLEDVAASEGMSPDELAAIKEGGDRRLRARREMRVAPGRDDKVITAWNGLAIRSLAEAGAVLRKDRYIEAAERAAEFCLSAHLTGDGRVLRSSRKGQGAVPGFCDDYASLALGSITLFEATGDDRWFRSARSLVHQMIDLFADPHAPGFYSSGRDAEALISRPKSYMDNPIPSDNALAAEALQRLHALTGEARLREHAERAFAAAGVLMTDYPAAASYMLAVLAADPPREVAVVGTGASHDALRAVVWETYRPSLVLAPGDGTETEVPLLAARSPGARGARAYVCENFVCTLPVSQPDALRSQISS